MINNYLNCISINNLRFSDIFYCAILSNNDEDCDTKSISGD